MDSRLFDSKLINHKIFKDLKGSLTDNPTGKLRNLIDIRDDVLYVWSTIENCLLCLNLKRLEENEEETPYQQLHLLSPPAFPVERVAGSPCGGRVCVWGARGAAVAELPARWGRGGLFDSGSHTVLCKSHSLDERLLYSQCEVRRALWHPSSLSHILVLVSDNTIRLYNIAIKGGPKLVKIFTIGPKPSSQLAGKTILDSLGDTAVDFTATPDSEALLILRGNGDVYMMECDLDGKNPLHPKLSGPLAMYPPADDNYGTDSCAILALGSGGGGAPPLVVVATCSAVLYHCLLLPAPQLDNNNSLDCHALYVVENVALNIALLPDDDPQYSFPVHLYACSSSTYCCAHAGGVHSVALHLLRPLRDYAAADDADSETALSSICSRPSSARHLVAGRGIALAATPPPLAKAIVLCEDATLLIRTLEPFDLVEQLYKELQLRNPALEQDDINDIIKERQKLSFTAIMQEILSRDADQPLLRTAAAARDPPTAKDALELFASAMVRLRTEYMSRQQRALDAAKRKGRALSSLAEQHRAWVTDLQSEVEEVTKKSALLKEKCAYAEKHQDDLKYRCSTVIRHLRSSSLASPAERALIAELEQSALRRDKLTQQIQMLKEHVTERKEEMKQWQEEYKKKDIALGKSHSDTISSILQKQTSQISTLIEETKLLKDQLSIV